jgi:endonuclease YncB( thermonuclease family)
MIGGIYISNIRFKKIKLCLTSLTFLIIPFFVLTSCIKQSDSIYISEVIDGDTFQDSENIRYRLLGVDTPESFDSSNNFLPTKGLQKFYASKATNLSSQEILHKNVVIKK